MLSEKSEIWERARREVSRLLDEVRRTPDELLRDVTTSLSIQIPGTWIAALMGDETTSSFAFVTDHASPEVADYIDRYMAHISRSGRIPTTGLSQRVIDSGMPLLIPRIRLDDLLGLSSSAARDYWSSNQTPIALSEESTWGVLWVPIRARGTTLGSLAVGDHRPDHHMAEADVAALQAIADQVGLALRAAQVETAAARLSYRLAALESVVVTVSAGSDLPTTLRVILDQLVETAAIDAVDILVIDPASGTIHVVASRGFYSSYSANEHGACLADAWTNALESGSVDNLQHLDLIEHSWRRSRIAREGFISYRGIACRFGGKLVGVIEAFHRSAFEPNQQSIAFIDVLSDLAAIAIERASVPVVRNTLDRSQESGRRRPIPDLSRREKEVLRLVAEGQSNLEIAQSSHRAESTIKSSVRQLLRKARVRNRTELVRVALQHGWLQVAGADSIWMMGRNSFFR
jgi:GAF domain-containing protein